MADTSTLSIAFHRLALAAFERVPVPAGKVPYLINQGSGWSNPVWRWRWACPRCKYVHTGEHKSDVLSVIHYHRCAPRESVTWPAWARQPARGERVIR